MTMTLTDAECRILGCLIEKEMTTPEYYPLSLNALVNACNQKSNRSPVVSYAESTVEQGLSGLQEKGFARMTHAAGSRVPKYLHTFLDRFDLSAPDMAVLCELLVRGPQTVGELRTHTGRITPIESLETVDSILQMLAAQEPPLVVQLEREPGRKERRYCHLLADEPDRNSATPRAEASAAPLPSPNREERISRLENEVTRLKDELQELKQQIAEIRPPI